MPIAQMITILHRGGVSRDYVICARPLIGVGMVGMIESKGERRARSGRDFHIYIVSTQRHSAVMISNHHHYILCVISYYIVFLSFTSNIVKI